jgi:HEAT repeat protein
MFNIEEIDRHLHTSWKEPCEEMFDALAHNHPSVLLNIIDRNLLHHTDLVFAIESAGRIQTLESIDSILKCLENEHPVVRESALYALSMGDKSNSMKAQNKIVEMSKNDENKTIRIIADEMLNH